MKSLEAVDLFLLISSLQICNQAMEATVRKGTIPVYLAGRCRWKGGAVMGFGHHGKFSFEGDGQGSSGLIADQI
jgi:hypothetical protein